MIEERASLPNEIQKAVLTIIFGDDSKDFIYGTMLCSKWNVIIKVTIGIADNNNHWYH